MTYQELKPAASDKLSTSQGDIQGNFQAIKDGDIDAVAYSLNRESSAPSPSNIGADSGFLYALGVTVDDPDSDDGTETTTELFWNNGDAAIQLTAAGAALWPKAFGTLAADGTLDTSTCYNVKKTGTQKNGTGRYDIVFKEAMPDTGYTVIVTGESIAESSDSATVSVRKNSKATTGFSINVRGADGSSVSGTSVNFVVYHTSAV